MQNVHDVKHNCQVTIAMKYALLSDLIHSLFRSHCRVPKSHVRFQNDSSLIKSTICNLENRTVKALLARVSFSRLIGRHQNGSAKSKGRFKDSIKVMEKFTILDSGPKVKPHEGEVPLRTRDHVGENCLYRFCRVVDNNWMLSTKKIARKIIYYNNTL